MKRKKILALTLAAAMSLALFSGCSRPSASSGGNDNPSANNTGSTSSEEPIVIKIGHTDSDTRSTHKWSVWLWGFRRVGTGSGVYSIGHCLTIRVPLCPGAAL